MDTPAEQNIDRFRGEYLQHAMNPWQRLDGSGNGNPRSGLAGFAPVLLLAARKA